MQKIVKLGDATAPRKEKVDPKNSDLTKFVGLEHIESNTGRLVDFANLATVRSSANRVYAGDVIYSRLRPYLNKVHHAEDEFAGSAEFIVFPPTEGLSQKYLQYVLMSPSFLKFAAILDTGDRPRVNWGGIRNYEFPLPQIHEQEEIVERTELALAKLDAALASINRAENLREIARMAILHTHFAPSLSGRDSLELSEVLEAQIGGAWGELPGSGEIEVKVLRATEMDKMGRLNLASAVDRSVTMAQYVSRELVPGDLVMEKSGGGPNQPVGRVGIYEGPTGGYITSNFMLKMRPNSALVDPNFLWLQLMYTHISGGTIAIQSSSTNIRNVTVSEYLNLELYVPSLEKQRSITREVNESMQVIDATAQQLATIKKFIETERRAILQAAFRAKGEEK
jgi:type I restriction enzyme S subunit